MAKYANVIVDISLDKLDKTFQYLIPEELKDTIREGMQVEVPFGNRSLAGFVMELTDEAEFDESKLKVAKLLDNKGIISDDIIKTLEFGSKYYQYHLG